MSYRYDLFVSYSTIDDRPAPGWISAFVDELRRVHRTFTPEELAIFFDREEIRVGEDWELRIKSALRDSALLLACVSPNYFSSKWCYREWQFYTLHELDRASGGEGISPIYLIGAEHPAESTVAQEVRDWMADLGRRQHLDLRAWFPLGIGTLGLEQVQRGLNVLDHRMDAIRVRSRIALEAPGTVDRHNSHFVGRREELRRLREMLASGAFGVITAVHGLGGVGKSALANEYAHAWAADYSLGRWLVHCEGKDDLATALLQLLTPLHIQLTDMERQDKHLAVQRLFAELEIRRTLATTDRRAPACCLLILDNVDHPAIVSDSQIARLPTAPWLHILVTTRLGKSEFLEREAGRQFLALDELPEEDALQLIQRLQPGEEFRSDRDRKAARAIVRRLGGFTLAVEAIAVYLGLHPEINCDQFCVRLASEGLEAPESVARDDAVSDLMVHRQKQLSLALEPTLGGLPAEDCFVLHCAAWLPPDCIPLPWLRAVAIARYPNLSGDRPGYPTPWSQMTRRLVGSRLLIPTSDHEADGSPRIVRMHRLVQELLLKKNRHFGVQTSDLLVEHAISCSEYLEVHWYEESHRWEIAPLRSLADHLLTDRPAQGYRLVKWISQWLARWDRSADVEVLLRKTLALQQHDQDVERKEIAITLSNLGNVLRLRGHLIEARDMLRQALIIDEEERGYKHPFTAIRCNSLALILGDLGEYAEAEALCRRGLAIREGVSGVEDPETLRSVNNLAVLLIRRGLYDAAEPFCRRALDARERTLGADHPETLASVQTMALWYKTTGDYSRAESLCHRALESRERLLGAEHPDTLASVDRLAELCTVTGNYTLAAKYYRRVVDARERALGAEHPETLTSVNGLARTVEADGDVAAAEALYQRVLDGRERGLGTNHPETIATLGEICDLLEKVGRVEESRELRRLQTARADLWESRQSQEQRKYSGLGDLATAAPRSRGLASTAHPGADAEGHARHNIEYRRALLAWKALPWWKRIRAPKPKAPPGVFA